MRCCAGESVTDVAFGKLSQRQSLARNAICSLKFRDSWIAQQQRKRDSHAKLSRNSRSNRRGL